MVILYYQGKTQVTKSIAILYYQGKTQVTKSMAILYYQGKTSHQINDNTVLPGQNTSHKITSKSDSLFTLQVTLSLKASWKKIRLNETSGRKNGMQGGNKRSRNVSFVESLQLRDHCGIYVVLV